MTDETKSPEYSHQDPLDAVLHIHVTIPEGTTYVLETEDVVEIQDEYGKEIPAGEWTQQPGSDTRTLTLTPRDILKALGLDWQETINCAFCGFTYRGEKPVSRDQLTQHVHQCAEHPLRNLDYCAYHTEGSGNCQDANPVEGVLLEGLRTTDLPKGWCWWCWRFYRARFLIRETASLKQLLEEQKALTRETEALLGQAHRQCKHHERERSHEIRYRNFVLNSEPGVLEKFELFLEELKLKDLLRVEAEHDSEEPA